MATATTYGSGRTLDRALALLARIGADNGSQSLREQAASIGLPLATAYRLVGQLNKHGLVMPGQSGRFLAGPAFTQIADTGRETTVLVTTARPLLRQLARRTRATVHLGVFDGEMVTYVVKESAGKSSVFTREGGQLEAYCSALGKVLLAHLQPQALEAYLATGPFPKLTDRTVTNTDNIRVMLAYIREVGHAMDDREISEDLYCRSVPVRDRQNKVIAAVSLSRSFPAGSIRQPPRHPPPTLVQCAAAIGRQLDVTVDG